MLKLLLSECDAADEQEEGQPSLVKMEERLKDAEALKTKVKDILQKLHAEDVRSLNSTDSQEIYKLRKQKVELPFGHIKRNLKVDSFLLRGLGGVRGEMGLLASCFNIAWMITIMGVSGLIVKFGS
jgi:hypothetical protein